MQPPIRSNLNRMTPPKLRPANMPQPLFLVRGTGPAHTRSPRRRGVVLILVVAVLGILFVAGAALLTQVTFSSKNISAMQADRENLEVVRQAERIATDALAAGFMGRDGIPASPESPLLMHQQGLPDVPCDNLGTNACVLTLPTVAEIPGVHPWIGVTEPIEAPDEDGVLHSEWKLHADAVAMVNLRPSIEPGRAFIDPEDWAPTPLHITATYDPDTPELSLAVHADNPLRSAYSSYEGYKYFQADADGDGVADAFEFRLPRSLLPTDVYDAVASRLRDPNVVGLTGTAALPGRRDENDLFVALRIVPHGAMANLNASPMSVRRTVLRYSTTPLGGEPTDEELFPPEGFSPEANEWLLRNRGLIPPQQLPTTRLIASMTEPLLRPHALDQSASAEDLLMWTKRRWWSYDAADVATANAAWRAMMFAQGPSSPTTTTGSGNLVDDDVYDVAHNLTTVSHDDLLIRAPRNTSGVDMVALMAGDDDYRKYGDPSDPNLHAWDNYPFHLDASGDRRLGRIKLSLPELDRWLNEHGLAMTDLAAPTTGQAERIRRTIQDAFLLMLTQRQRVYKSDKSYDPDLDARVRAVEAAMLTANLIDFADMDNTPTAVPVIGLDGAPILGADSSVATNTLVAYGFERQPFITELYLKTAFEVTDDTLKKDESSFAIELYNPYSTALTIPANTFYLQDKTATLGSGNDATVFKEGVAIMLPRLPLTKVPALQIPAGGYATLYSSGFMQPSASGTVVELASQGGNLWGFDDASRIQLMRAINTGTGVVNIAIDEFDVRGHVTPSPDPVRTQLIGEIRSWQRDTTASSAVSFWRCTVPVAGELNSTNLNVTNQAGTTSAYENTTVYPVHLDVANTGLFTTAFPTTGAMLLMSRMAHVYDPSDPAGASTPWTSPFNSLHVNLVGHDPSGNPHNIANEYNQIDNGRMPVFDLYALDPDSAPNPADQELFPPRYHMVPGWNSTAPAHVPGRSDGLEALPWGQLLFDYFTAIPLFPCPDPADSLDPTCEFTYPPVDQEGLRVSGRIDINTASWRVLAGLPMIPSDRFDTWLNSTYPDTLRTLTGAWPAVLGDDLAQGIVAYREARGPAQLPWGYAIVDDYLTARDPHASDADQTEFHPRHGYGFLTVGELLNVRADEEPYINARVDSSLRDNDDGAAVQSTYDGTDVTQCFEKAVANLVMLEDWVTTKSHVFTIYGVIRGAYVPQPESGVTNFTEIQDLSAISRQAVDQRAIRFQTTVDRLPMYFGAERPERIGAMTVEKYSDLRSN